MQCFNRKIIPTVVFRLLLLLLKIKMHWNDLANYLELWVKLFISLSDSELC